MKKFERVKMLSFTSKRKADYVQNSREQFTMFETLLTMLKLTQALKLMRPNKVYIFATLIVRHTLCSLLKLWPKRASMNIIL